MVTKMGWRFSLTLAAALGVTSTAGQAEASLSVPVSAERLKAERGCVDGVRFGSELLSVAERIDRCTALSEMDGGAYIGLFNRARARVSARELDAAVADFSAAIALNPQAAEAFFERGRVQFVYLEDAEAGLADFARAVVLEQTEPSYLMMQALSAIQLARESTGEEVATYLETARMSLHQYLELTEGSNDITQQIERQAAIDVLGRISEGNSSN